MKDFDKLFENFLRNELKQNEGLTPDELEDMIPELYERWATTPNPETDGLSPEEFFARVDDPEKLVGMFVESNEGDSNPCSLLCDRITEVKRLRRISRKTRRQIGRSQNRDSRAQSYLRIGSGDADG